MDDIIQNMIGNLHFNPLSLDSPRVCGLVQGLLHDVADGLALGQDLGQVFRTEHVSEGGGGQEMRRVARKMR